MFPTHDRRDNGIVNNFNKKLTKIMNIINCGVESTFQYEFKCFDIKIDVLLLLWNSIIKPKKKVERWFCENL